jgi:hypothetical protein
MLVVDVGTELWTGGEGSQVRKLGSCALSLYVGVHSVLDSLMG